MPAIVELVDKKSNKDNEVNFKQILNLLISQNISLQTQLNFAHEREKEYLAELTIYRQHYAQKTVQNSPKFEGNTQIELENNVVDTNENYQNQMQSKIENQAHLKSCQSTKQEIESMNEAGNSPLPTESIHNEISLSKSKSCDTESKNESTEQNAGALVGIPIPPQDDTKLLLNKNRQEKPTASVVKRITKNVLIIPTPCKSDRTPINKSIEDQDNIDKKDHHNYKQ